MTTARRTALALLAVTVGLAFVASFLTFHRAPVQTIRVSSATPLGGHRYYFQLPHADWSAQKKVRATVELREDGRPLGPAYATMPTVERYGQGAYSFWKDGLYFSSSDNTNPAQNRRTYEVVEWQYGAAEWARWGWIATGAGSLLFAAWAIVLAGKTSAMPARVLPLPALSALGGLLVFLLAVLGLLEWQLLPRTAARGMLTSDDWSREDAVINANTKAENPDDTNPEQDWVWRSASHTVSKLRTSPFRILVMGDSFVWGDGYANFNDTLWRQLQRELVARGYGAVEVIAAGKSGASTRKQIDAARRILPDYSPDLVIWQYVTNDPDEELIRQFDAAFIDSDTVASGLQRLGAIGVFPGVCRQMLDLRRKKVQNLLTPEITGYAYEDWEYQILGGENFARYRETLAELARLQSESGKPFMMVPVPNSPDPNRERLYAPVRTAVTEAGIPWVETLPRLIQETSTLGSTSSVLEWGINPANGHPGILVTHLIGRQVADALERDHPEILGDKTVPPGPRAVQVNQWRPWNLAVQANQPGAITFTYPDKEDLMLRMPYGVPRVLLNFAMPVAVGEVAVAGDGLASARLFYSGQDPANLLESHRPKDGGQKSGKQLTWQLTDASRARFLNSVAISAEFSSPDRTLHVTFRRQNP